MASRQHPGRHNVIHSPAEVDSVELETSEEEAAETDIPNSDSAPQADSNEAT